MNEFLLNRALTQIDDRYLTMADQTVKEVQTMRQKHFSTRKLVRTILIAAVITALLGITAYAFSSIHTARQQRLRAELQIEVLAAFIPGKMAVFVFLSLCFGIFDLMLPSAWALCIDLGKHHAGSISGAMNTAGNIGGFCCGILFGELVQSSGNYNLPLYMIAAMLIVSAILFAFINPAKPIINE
mgnify:CR=1 FL=1